MREWREGKKAESVGGEQSPEKILLGNLCVKRRKQASFLASLARRENNKDDAAKI